MKKVSLILPICILQLLFCNHRSQSQTTIPPGNVSGTWTLASSPYQINGDITIPDDSTLTIEPGVLVEFQGYYKLNMQGRLLAVGTSADTITFTVRPDSIASGWRGIRFYDTPATNDTSKIIYCKVQYVNATAFYAAIYVSNFSKLRITNSRISNNTSSYPGGAIFLINCNDVIIKSNIISYNSTTSDGGGIFSQNSDIILTNNVISSNDADEGGGIYFVFNIDNLNPDVSNNIINDNIATGYGGGIYIRNIFSNSSPVLLNNTINNNSSTSGGGIFCGLYASPAIMNNIISNNTSTSSFRGGGGIFCDQDANPVITNNTITNNNTSYKGGGVLCYGSNSNPILINNIISNNVANYRGGGFCCSTNSEPTLINNVIVNNDALEGGGIACDFTGTNLNFTNNTICNNSATNGGGIYLKSSEPVLTNTILWGNNASNLGNQVYLEYDVDDPTISYCNIQGSTATFGFGTGTYTGSYTNNIDIIPQFVSSSGGAGTGFNGLTADWSLQAISPCINQGNPDTTGLNLPVTDRAGNPRIVSNVIDIGAFEYNVTTGINLKSSISNYQLKVQPNPNTGEFTVTFKIPVPSVAEGIEKQNINLKVFNIVGQVIYEENLIDFTGKYQNKIDMSGYAKGIYSLQLSTKDKTINKKIILE